MKKIISVIMLSTMLVSILASCGSRDVQDESISDSQILDSTETSESNYDTDEVNNTDTETMVNEIWEDASEEIKSADIESGKLQINNRIITMPIVLGDFSDSVGMEPDFYFFGDTLRSGVNAFSIYDEDVKDFEFRQEEAYQSLAVINLYTPVEGEVTPAEECMLAGLWFQGRVTTSHEIFDVILPGGLSVYKEYPAEVWEETYPGLVEDTTGDRKNINENGQFYIQIEMNEETGDYYAVYYKKNMFYEGSLS